MKKLNLQLGSIKEMLTKEQMKKVAGGYNGLCCWGAIQCTWSIPGDPTPNRVVCPVATDCYTLQQTADCLQSAYSAGADSSVICQELPYSLRTPCA